MVRSVWTAVAAMVALACGQANGAVIVSVNQAGSTTANLSGYTFSLANLDNATGGLESINFAGSSITGTRTAGWVNIAGANVYGGAGGAGLFGTVQGDPAAYQLSQSVNYLGLWGSALDGANAVALYNDDILLGSFSLQTVLQSSPGFDNAYYGNPFGGGNSGELYAFFNFQSDTAFNRFELIQNGGGGFEFDNVTIGSAVVSTAPEPATWGMMMIGFALIGLTARGYRLPGWRRTATARSGRHSFVPFPTRAQG